MEMKQFISKTKVVANSDYFIVCIQNTSQLLSHHTKEEVFIIAFHFVLNTFHLRLRQTF